MTDTYVPGQTEYGDNLRAKILTFVAQFHTDNGIAPTVREIQNAISHASPGTTQVHINRLIREGKLAHIPKSPRSLRVVS